MSFSSLEKAQNNSKMISKINEYKPFPTLPESLKMFNGLGKEAKVFSFFLTVIILYLTLIVVQHS